jgi:hypothetical protein
VPVWGGEVKMIFMTELGGKAQGSALLPRQVCTKQEAMRSPRDGLWMVLRVRETYRWCHDRARRLYGGRHLWRFGLGCWKSCLSAVCSS